MNSNINAHGEDGQEQEQNEKVEVQAIKAKRKKYTKQDNKEIMTCYYKSSPTKGGYMKRVFRIWKVKHLESESRSMVIYTAKGTVYG